MGRGRSGRQLQFRRVFLQDISDLMAPLNHGRLQGVDDTCVHLPAVEISHAAIFKTETSFGQCTELRLAILYVSSTFHFAPGKLAPLSLSPQGEAVESCLGLGPISRKRWSWGHERGAWYPETQPVAIHFGSGCYTEEVPQPKGVCGQWWNDSFSRNGRCRLNGFNLTFS